MYKKIIFCATLCVLVVGCGEATESKLNIADASSDAYSSGPGQWTPQDEPPPKRCDVVKAMEAKDCMLYFLKCEDGSDDMFMLCPTRYYDPGEYVPTPVIDLSEPAR